MDTEDLDEMGLDTEMTIEALADRIGVVNWLVQPTASAKTPGQDDEITSRFVLIISKAVWSMRCKARVSPKFSSLLKI
jgi:hypothetical protein